MAFGSPDCSRCGGYYPGNPGAYMGTWCRCDDKKEKKKEKKKKEEK